MADTRHKNVIWTLPQDGYSWTHVQVALLMDIRDELQANNAELRRIRSVIECSNFTSLPHVIARIARNTHKPRKRKPKAVPNG